MNSKVERTTRVAGLIQRDISRLLKQKAHDPRFQHITVTRVFVTRDFKHAKLFISSPFNDSVENGVKALNKAAAYFRRLLAMSLQLRSIPKLLFVCDVELQKDLHMIALIEKLDDLPFSDCNVDGDETI